MIWVICGSIVFVTLAVVYSICWVSGACSRREDERERAALAQRIGKL